MIKLQARIFNLLSAYLHGKEVEEDLFTKLNEDEWELLVSTLSLHAMTSVGYYGLAPLIEKGMAPEKVKMKIIHEVLSAERSNTMMQALVGKLHEFFKEANVKCLLLKGPSLAAYYKKSCDRKYVDLDIYSPNQGKKVDELFRSKGVKVHDDFYRHSGMILNGVSVENHHYLLDVQGRSYQVERDNDLKALAIKYLEDIEEPGLYYPDAKFSTMFNMHHALSHLIYEGISLRFILDWGLFLKSETIVVKSPEVESLLRKHNLMKLAAAMSKVLVDKMDYPMAELPDYLIKEISLIDDRLMSQFYEDLFRKYEVIKTKNLLRDRFMTVRRILRASWKVRAFLGESPFAFVVGKIIPILRGKKFEAD